MHYTFQPVVDTSNDHTIFYVFLAMAIVALVFVILDYLNKNCSSTTAIVSTVIITTIMGLGWKISYTPYHPENISVVGTFVKFQPEGYNERHGKTRSDEHYMYVVYNVEGKYVILLADEGMTYPSQAVLYKNKGDCCGK